MTENLSLNYSLIIPHKNIPNLLKRCLDSIPQRDDMEIILVDDNSDPNIVDFEHFPGKTRQGVRLIFDKQGGGAGRARNWDWMLRRGRLCCLQTQMIGLPPVLAQCSTDMQAQTWT